MKQPGFLGGTGAGRSPNVNAEWSINAYPEFRQKELPKDQPVMFRRPGYRVFADLGSAPIRAIFGQDGRCFAVTGPSFYEIFANHSVAYRGEVAVDSDPATIDSNGTSGNQLFIVAAGQGYIFDLTANTLTHISALGFPNFVKMGGYTDNYFLVLSRDTGQFQISALNNGLEWSSLDVSLVSQFSDKVVSMVINHREVWLFGSKHIQPWYNTGNATTPFQPMSGGVVIESGIAAPWSAQRLDNAIMWVEGDERGSRIVRRAQGYTPVRISNHTIEYRLGQTSQVNRILAWTYQDEGHLYYALYVPDLDTQLVYDVAADVWHERALWVPELYRYIPDVPRCHAYIFDRHLVGDRLTGGIYEMSLDYYDDQIFPVRVA